MSGFGQTIFGRQPFGWSGTTTAFDPGALRTFYQEAHTLELWQAGTRIVNLPNWISARYAERMNEPSTLEFTYPADDSAVASIAFPAYVVVRDRDGETLDRLYVQRKTLTRRDDGALQASIACEGFLGALGRETLESYSSGGDKRVSTIIGELLAEQAATYTTRISYGSIGVAVGSQVRTVDVTNKSILAILRDLWLTIGGEYWLDAEGAFRWAPERYSDWGQRLSITSNMATLDVATDYSALRTRVVCHGKDGATGVSTKNTSTYGTITEVISFPDQGDKKELQRRAAEIVRGLAQPKRRVSATAIDLSLAQDQRLDYSWNAIRCGSRILVRDEGLDQSIATRILSVSRDLAFPVFASVVVGDPAGGRQYLDNAETIIEGETLSDVIADILDGLDDITDIVIENPALDIVARWRFRVDGGDWVETAQTNYTPEEDLDDGTHIIEVQERDEAGNWSASGSYSTRVGASYAAPPLLEFDARTNSATPTLRWTSGGGGTGRYLYQLFRWEQGTRQIIVAQTTFAEEWTTGNLTDGGYEFRVAEYESEVITGGWAAARFVVDTEAPPAPIVSGTNKTPDATPSWSWTRGVDVDDEEDDEDPFEPPVDPDRIGWKLWRYKVDDGEWVETYERTYTPEDELANGVYTLYVQEQDDAGNWSESGSFAVTVDETLAPAPNLSVDADPNNDGTPTWSWTSSAETGTGEYTYAIYRYDRGERQLFQGGTTNLTSLTPSDTLPDGEYQFNVSETTTAGTLSATATLKTSIDQTPPPPPIVDGTGRTRDTTPTWTWRSGQDAPDEGYVPTDLAQRVQWTEDSVGVGPGSATVELTVFLDAQATADCSVYYETLPGTALPDVTVEDPDNPGEFLTTARDYRPAFGKIEIAEGETQATIELNVTVDMAIEEAIWFYVYLRNHVDCELGSPVRCKVVLTPEPDEPLDDDAQLLQFADDVEPVGATSDPGDSGEVAHANHIHDYTFATGATQSIGVANTDGTSTLPAHADHVHAGVTSFGDNIQAVGSENDAGEAETAARSDHVHAGPAGSDDDPQDIVADGAEDPGEADDLSRSDHKHACVLRGLLNQNAGDGYELAYTNSPVAANLSLPWIVSQEGISSSARKQTNYLSVTTSGKTAAVSVGGTMYTLGVLDAGGIGSLADVPSGCLGYLAGKLYWKSPTTGLICITHSEVE